ncbi:hypothetical protein K2X85_20275 [bacterium]|nr:hypothetical protein [bacterium]
MSPIWVDVDAGRHARRLLPFCIPLDADMVPDNESVACLDREGLKRSIPCQLEKLADQTRLWWIINEMEPDEKDRYSLSFDRRQRNSPIHWKIESTPKGWTLAEQDLRVLNLITGRGNPVSLLLSGPAGRLGRVHPGAFLQVENQPHHRRAPARPAIVARGPVFARISLAFDVRDEHDLLLMREEIDVRVFPGQRGARVIDVDFAWIAAASPITLINPSSSQPVFWPTVILEPETADFQVTSSSGRIGLKEISGHRAEWIDVDLGLVRWVTIARSASFGFPPRVNWNPPVLELSPPVSDSPPVRGPIRLALGEEYRLSLRLLIMPTIGRTVDDVISMSLDPSCKVTATP